MVNYDTKGDKIFNAVNAVLLFIITLLVVYPIWFVLCASISDPVAVNMGEMLFWPKDITFSGYEAVFRDPEVLSGYRNSIIYTLLGTLVALATTLPAAYALSRKDLIGGSIFTKFFLVTMFFNGGLIPTYLVVQKLGMTGRGLQTVWPIILLGAVGMTNIVISRTFFISSIPLELQEAAQIDGASNFQIFTRVILPLSKPIIAVMALFAAVSHWNNYFTAMIYINDVELKPLQLILREVLTQAEYNAKMVEQGAIDVGDIQESLRVQELIRYSLIVVATLPVMVIYPFIQKYFVKGIMVGSVKA